MFQSTPPHGGRRGTAARWWPIVGFNPRPRTGGDTLSLRAVGVIGVSIHAPARGATGGLVYTAIGWRVFQSTPPHGGRRAQQLLHGGRAQPRFNPRPRTGATVGLWNPRNEISAFQSTPPHGGRRPREPDPSSPTPRFNPRPRTGGDAQPGYVGGQCLVSIHAPARGATREMELYRQDFTEVSIHAPARGATHLEAGAAVGMQFQSTPPHGGRRSPALEDGHTRSFQSTPPHGGRHDPPVGRGRHVQVSIHAPARGATAVT